MTTISTYRQISQNIDRSIEQVRTQAFVERETEYYLANIATIKSIDDFLADRRLFNYALKAHGLSDMSYATALLKKALEEGIDERTSFANTLADSRYREFVSVFNFARHGETTTIFDKTRTETVDRYLRQTLEEDAGNDNQGVRLALYFQRKAPKITSIYGILGDRALLEVARTTLGLPIQISVLDIDRQAELLGRQISVDDFKDPEKLSRFIERFAASWEIANPSANNAPAVANLLLSPSGGIGTDLLLSLQKLKTRG